MSPAVEQGRHDVEDNSEHTHLLSRWIAFAKRASPRIGIGISLGILVALTAFPIVPRYYTASITVGPTSAAPAMAGLGGLSGFEQGGGTGLAGKLSTLVGTGGSSPLAPFSAFQSALSSMELSDRLLRRQDLMHRLFPDEWNAETRRWEAPRGIFSSLKSAVKEALGLPGWHPPDAEQLQLFIADQLEIQPVASTPLITLSFSAKNPATGRDFLEAIYEDAEGIVRNMDRDRSTQIIKGVQERLSRSNDLPDSAKSDIISFLSQEYQISVLTTTKTAYAAATFDPLYVSARPTSPRLTTYLLLGIFFGALVGLFSYLTDLPRAGWRARIGFGRARERLRFS